MQERPFHFVHAVFAAFSTPRIEHGTDFRRFDMWGNPNIETALGHGWDTIVRIGIPHLNACLQGGNIQRRDITQRFLFTTSHGVGTVFMIRQSQLAPLSLSKCQSLVGQFDQLFNSGTVNEA